MRGTWQEEEEWRGTEREEKRDRERERDCTGIFIRDLIGSD